MTELNNTADLYADYLNSGEVDDMTKGGGSFEQRIIPEGKTLGRLVEYIEIGKRKQKPYKGKEKPDHLEARITFELLGKKNIREIGEGENAREIGDTITVTCPVKGGSRARYGKLLSKLAYGRNKIHIAQCVGDAYLITVVHNKKEAEGDKPARTFFNITDADGNFLIDPPVMIQYDEDTGEPVGEKPIKVRQPFMAKRVFLWDMPLKAAWDGLFIDGVREYTKKNEKGEEVTVTKSKNWLQELLLEATDFKGSKLEAMLKESGEGLPPLADEDDVPDDLMDDIPAGELDDEIPF